MAYCHPNWFVQEDKQYLVTYWIRYDKINGFLVYKGTTMGKYGNQLVFEDQKKEKVLLYSSQITSAAPTELEEE